MRRVAIDPEMAVDEILRRWPSTIRVLLRYRMLCVGCPIGIFHTIADACAAHGVDRQAFEADLLAAMGDDSAASLPSAFGPAAETAASRDPDGAGRG